MTPPSERFSATQPYGFLGGGGISGHQVPPAFSFSEPMLKVSDPANMLVQMPIELSRSYGVGTSTRRIWPDNSSSVATTNCPFAKAKPSTFKVGKRMCFLERLTVLFPLALSSARHSDQSQTLYITEQNSKEFFPSKLADAQRVSSGSVPSRKISDTSLCSGASS